MEIVVSSSSLTPLTPWLSQTTISSQSKKKYTGKTCHRVLHSVVTQRPFVSIIWASEDEEEPEVNIQDWSLESLQLEGSEYI